MLKRLEKFVILCILSCLFAFPANAEKFYPYEQELPFTTVSWGIGGQNRGPNMQSRVVNTPLKMGNSSLEFTYDFIGVEGQYNNCEFGTSLSLPDNAQELKIWIYGDGSGHNFILRLQDPQGQIFQYRSIPINWQGWRLLEFKLREPGSLATFWGGANDGVLGKSLRLRSLLVESREKTFVGTGRIYIGGIIAKALLPESESLKVEISSDKLGNIFTSDDKVQFALKFNNYSDVNRVLELRYWVQSANDRVYLGDTITVPVGANEAITRSLQLGNFNVFGCFDLALQVRSKDRKIMLKQEIPFSRCLPPSTKPRNSIIGAQTHFGHEWSPHPLEPNLELLYLGGATWYRDEMLWKYAEREKGKIEVLPHWDERINKSLELGLTPFVILAFWNPFYDDGRAPYTEEGIQAFARYCSTIAEHFKGRVSHFQIWNEYNIAIFNPDNRPPDNYAKMLKAAYTAIKEVNPDALVIQSSTAGVDLDWIERLFKAGGLDYMDGVAVHTYCFPRSPEEGNYVQKLQLVTNLMKRYGQVKPIWITEMGWPTNTSSRGVTELQAAAYVVRLYVLTLSSDLPVSMLCWYNLQNRGTNPAEREQNFGLVRHHSSEVPFAAKQNFIAYNTMNRMLEDATYLERLESESYLHAYKFALADQEQMLVLWAVSRQETIGIKTMSQSVTVVDLFGNRYTAYPIDGIVTLTVSDLPQYLIGDFSNAAICAPRFAIEEPATTSLAGEEVTIRIQRSVPEIAVEQVLVDLPSGWTVKEKKNFSRDSLQAEVVCQLPAFVENKSYDLPIYLVGNNRVLGQLLYKVDVNEPLELLINPALGDVTDWENWNLAVTVVNRSSSRSASGWVNILKPTQFSQYGDLNFVLGPNEQHTFELPFEGFSKTPIDVAAEVTSFQGEYLMQEKKISFLAAVRAKTPIVIDGNITDDEWGNAMPFNMDQAHQLQKIENWGGPNDLSGVGYLQWDDEYLYLGVSVTDDIHHQEGVEGDIWCGDSIQFAIDPTRKWGVGLQGHHDLGFALGDKGVITWRWLAAYGMDVGPFPATAKVAIKRQANITSYEAAIPWSELVVESPTSGTILGFSILVNDNDGFGRRGWIEYMSGIGYAKDPNLFGDLLLID